MQKGSQVFVSGKFTTEKYEKEGQTRYSTKVIANDVQFLGGKPEGSGAHQSRPESDNRPAQSAAQSMVTDEGFDDDIPF